MWTLHTHGPTIIFVQAHKDMLVIFFDECPKKLQLAKKSQQLQGSNRFGMPKREGFQ